MIKSPISIVGSCDVWGDLDPNSATHVRVEVRTASAIHGMALDHDHAVELRDQLNRVLKSMQRRRSELVDP